MQCKSHQGVVELVLAGELSDEDVLHPIVENLFGNAAEMVEGVNMAIQKGRQIALFNELGVDPPRKAEDHRKKIDLPDVPSALSNWNSPKSTCD
jgi:hypothetical protein